MQSPTPVTRLRPLDFALLAAFCFLLFGVSLVGGRCLTMHEAVLPQSAKEMALAGEWVVPTSGGRPWLERPPLPQWLVMASNRLVGNFESEWAVRLPSVLVASLSVLLTAAMAARWYGRATGVVAGLALATMLEFTRYAWLAEQDIYLCALVMISIALFARLAINPVPSTAASATFFGTRPWGYLAFFVALGATNLAKGLLFGTAMAAIPMAGFLLSTRRWQLIRPFVWFWGWMAWLAVAVAWPIAAYWRYPDVLDLWLFDHVGRLTGEYTDINEPVWYYWANLPLATAPWFAIALAGLALSARRFWRAPAGPDRFVWCWAFLPIIVFTIPGGKHHHYMLHFMAPWAILTAHGLIWLKECSVCWPRVLRQPEWAALALGLPLVLAGGWAGAYLGLGPLPVFGVMLLFACVSAALPLGLFHERRWVWAGSLFSFLAVIYATGFILVADRMDQCRVDTAFLREVRPVIDLDAYPLVVNADLESMDLFRILFYLGPKARAIHNLTFLNDASLTDRTIHVVTRAKDKPILESMGAVTRVMQTPHTRRELTPADRLTLFRLDFDERRVGCINLERVSPMQAMYREAGPFLLPARTAMNR